MVTKYIFYVPPTSSLQFRDALSMLPLQNTYLETRVYDPKQPITMVTNKDYVIFCIDMGQGVGNIGDNDGDCNSFLAQAACYGNKVSVLMKGAPMHMNFQKWAVQKGKLLTQLERDGRLITWESISTQMSGTDQSNRLQRFMKIIQREDKSENRFKLSLLLLLAILAVIVGWKVHEIRNTSYSKISELTAEKLQIQRYEEANNFLQAIRNNLEFSITNCSKEISEWNKQVDEIDKKLKQLEILSDEQIGSTYRDKQKFSDQIDYFNETVIQLKVFLEEIERVLKVNLREQELYVAVNQEHLQDISNKTFCIL